MVRSRNEEKTGFQESGPYHPAYDLQTDFVMVYGIDDSMPTRIQQWKDRGYIVHLMTGVAWGNYENYLNGQIDGRTHWDEAQMDRHEERIIHGDTPEIPYMVPTLSYAKFLAERIRIAVDAGVEAIHLEEPEFWVNGGYSEAFQREWRLYYKEPWAPPHSSPDAQFRASKLKAYLYTRALDRLCTEMKDYCLTTYGRDLRFYVPTHSLINYTQWRIVSPESQLIDLPSIDGYIAQIWTGTSRTPNVYQGLRKERTFETAYLEYGMMQELVRGTGRRMWFLHDPIEDNPNYTWSDYQQNYYQSVTASLLHPAVSHFEVSPWPRRIFQGKYPSEDGTGKESIPQDYATTLLQVMHTLGHMDQDWEQTEDAMQQVGVFIADSAMFQRMKIEDDNTPAITSKYDGTNSEALEAEGDIELLNFSPFYGLALPLLKHGIPVRPVQLDNVRRFAHYLNDYKVLVLSYEFMKPEYPDLHFALAGWVRNGGALVYVGDDTDPYHGVRAWWNETDSKYACPREHLFEQFGLKDAEDGVYQVGKGAVGYLPVAPEGCAISEEGANALRTMVMKTMEALNNPDCKWRPKHYFQVCRGPYIIAAVLDESVADSPVTIPGPVVDLFDPSLSVKHDVQVAPGEQVLLFDLEKGRVAVGEAGCIAASSRIESGSRSSSGFEFQVKGPEDMSATARFYCSKQPVAAVMDCHDKAESIPFEWDEASGTVLLRYCHRSDTDVVVKVSWEASEVQ
ncbi:hypothetical protein BVG16_07255 [Paenibacillus selenitireducens]|uniref:Beta-galactosidase trimerisation domain-containing protein n=1 Tax=Paenibacillus selenitireducens TaxID=1324314 RepID=A0A1T2XLA9_9BACL|nr:hypothetical protein [Paenibacillus selenitireducens]OPA80516.1 hypothetical protein BVG16_07255 [Paenibacillus selenitireducens]